MCVLRVLAFSIKNNTFLNIYTNIFFWFPIKKQTNCELKLLKCFVAAGASGASVTGTLTWWLTDVCRPLSPH